MTTKLTWKERAIRAEAEQERLTNLINHPVLNDFIQGVAIEAAHQIDRWGEDHDEDKTDADWIAVFVHLLGKFPDAFWSGKNDKVLHHLIAISAVAANCHRIMVKRHPL